MRVVLPMFLALCAVPAGADEITSEYTRITTESCTTFAAAGEGDGDWARLTCDGYRGYPVMIDYSDLRESVFYGFPPAGEMAPRWESFGNFNSTSDTIEWRIGPAPGDLRLPFATIHRWTVSPGDGADTQVLVVEKVGQPETRQGCVVGYVVATGNPDANVQARQLADEFAANFDCSGGEPVIREGSRQLPPVYVADR